MLVLLLGLAAGSAKLVRDELAADKGPAAKEGAEPRRLAVEVPQDAAVERPEAAASVRSERTEALVEVARTGSGRVDATSLQPGMQLHGYVLLEQLSEGKPPPEPCPDGFDCGKGRAKVMHGSARGVVGEELGLGKIGGGAYGTVWKARKHLDPAKDLRDCPTRTEPCLVALKVLWSSLSQNDLQSESNACGILKRLHDKAKTAKVDSSMIMLCHEDQVMEHGYLVFELLHGKDLERISARSVTPGGQLTDLGNRLRHYRRELMAHLTMGVHLMSELKVPGFPQVIHRDLKPGNLVVHLPAVGDPRDVAHVKIVDFGLAQEYWEDWSRADPIAVARCNKHVRDIHEDYRATGHEILPGVRDIAVSRGDRVVLLDPRHRTFRGGIHAPLKLGPEGHAGAMQPQNWALVRILGAATGSERVGHQPDKVGAIPASALAPAGSVPDTALQTIAKSLSAMVGQPKASDLGNLCHSAEDLRMQISVFHKSFIGSTNRYPFAPPEVFDQVGQFAKCTRAGKPAVSAFDMYSLGVVNFCMSTPTFDLYELTDWQEIPLQERKEALELISAGLPTDDRLVTWNVRHSAGCTNYEGAAECNDRQLETMSLEPCDRPLPSEVCDTFRCDNYANWRSR